MSTENSKADTCNARHRATGNTAPDLLTCCLNAGHGEAPHLDPRFGLWSLPANDPAPDARCAHALPVAFDGKDERGHYRLCRRCGAYVQGDQAPAAITAQRGCSGVTLDPPGPIYVERDAGVDTIHGVETAISAQIRQAESDIEAASKPGTIEKTGASMSRPVMLGPVHDFMPRASTGPKCPHCRATDTEATGHEVTTKGYFGFDENRHTETFRCRACKQGFRRVYKFEPEEARP